MRAESGKSLRRRFVRMTWQSGLSGGTACGAGSTLGATLSIREALPLLLERHNVRLLNDAGCGDQVWLEAWTERFKTSGIDYLGYDVRPVGEQPLPYAQLEIVHEAMREADLILCKDVFIHLRNETVTKALDLFRGSAPLLLSTTYPGVNNAARGHMRSFAPLDLSSPPFGLGKALETIEVPAFGGPQKQLALWRIR